MCLHVPMKRHASPRRLVLAAHINKMLNSYFGLEASTASLGLTGMMTFKLPCAVDWKSVSYVFRQSACSFPDVHLNSLFGPQVAISYANGSTTSCIIYFEFDSQVLGVPRSLMMLMTISGQGVTSNRVSGSILWLSLKDTFV